MNRSIALTTLLITALAVGGCGRSDQRSIVGTWTGKNDDGQQIVLTLTAHGTIKVNVDGAVAEGAYQVDLSKIPSHIDFDLGSGRKSETIVQLLDERLVRIEENNFGETRPQTFTEAAVVLTRKHAHSGSVLAK